MRSLRPLKDRTKPRHRRLSLNPRLGGASADPFAHLTSGTAKSRRGTVGYRPTNTNRKWVR